MLFILVFDAIMKMPICLFMVLKKNRPVPNLENAPIKFPAGKLCGRFGFMKPNSVSILKYH